MGNRNKVIALVAAALIAATALALVLKPDGRSGPTNPQAAAGPVLLVPGFGGSTDSLEPLAARLRADGRDVTIVDLGDATGDLDAQAQTLASAVAQVRDRTATTYVDLVGYSDGGVVARLFVKNLGGAGVVRRLVTLGSPHHGTRIASLGIRFGAAQCTQACRQVAPDSALLKALNKGDETPSGPTYVSIYTDLDQVVTPPESARLAGALNLKVQSICAGSQVNHSTLPTDPVMLGIITTELSDGAPQGLDSSDCARVSS